MTSYSDTLQRGDTISCYQIEEVLGRGGFAVTYLAVDLNLDVQVAIKEYLPREIIHRDQQLNVAARKPEFIDDYNIGLNNFAREAKTLARFKHPNIVRVHQVIHKYNTAYMVMDYEHGRELADVLAEQPTLPEDTLHEVLFPILDGVEEIHRHGLAHRDIKPSNIYLRDNGSPVLLDFGAARYTMSEFTQQLTAVVTVGYTPIEQYNVSENEQGPWTDVYALAAVLYEATTGAMPVDSVTRASSRVTNSTDPLAPVASKANGQYSDYFLNAIDWGLNMEAEDRPQSIAQWRDAFNGVFKPAESYEQQVQAELQKRPARKSKLKTRARDAVNQGTGEPVTETSAYESDTRVYDQQPQTPAHTHHSMAATADPHVSLDMRDTPFDPNFDDDIDHIEIVPLNPDAGAPAPSRQTLSASSATYHDATATLEPPPLPASPFASNPLHRQDLQREDSISDTLNNLIDAEGRPKHTQELRKVLRRDIVRREPPAVHSPQAEPAPQPEFVENRRQAPVAPPPDVYIDSGYQDQTRPMAPEQPAFEDDFEFDDSDWDYEPPAGPSRWRWIMPLAGLAAVAGVSLLYVNKPELFQFPVSGQEMTVDAALEEANAKIQSRELIFPTGRSALDYFQLVLQTAPDNAEALGGVAAIRDAIKKQIVEHVDDDNLSEANRLLSRANAANLQIDGVLENNATTSGSVSSDRTAAIDTTASPWITERIDDINALIAAGDYAAADRLFKDVDKYIPNAEVSEEIKQRIENGKNATDSALAATSSTTVATPVDTSPIIAEGEPTANTPSSTVAATVAVTETSTDAAGFDSNIVANTSETQALTVPAAPPADQPAENITQSVDNTVPEVEQKISSPGEDATLPSAPRRSFIEGNDATAQHLNQLRLALEDKNIQRVLRVSDSLPEERTEFLRKLFQRYDRLDVTIDNIDRSGPEATAKLSVAMFNQRSDGSFYSAGKWSDVELAASQINGQWQPIQW